MVQESPISTKPAEPSAQVNDDSARQTGRDSTKAEDVTDSYRSSVRLED